MGVMVSAETSESMTATPTVTPNWKKNRPIVPLRNATGRKMARIDKVAARAAKPISLEPSRADLRSVLDALPGCDAAKQDIALENRRLIAELREKNGALEIDPNLVAALINLANIHYSRDEIAEAQALYARAIALDPDVFEAHFNLGNIFHDLGRYDEAQVCYYDALRLNPSYADAHFYLAVTLEKAGKSLEARAHWRAYRQLAPDGEWVELAREFGD